MNHYSSAYSQSSYKQTPVIHFRFTPSDRSPPTSHITMNSTAEVTESSLPQQYKFLLSGIPSFPLLPLYYRTDTHRAEQRTSPLQLRGHQANIAQRVTSLNNQPPFDKTITKAVENKKNNKQGEPPTSPAFSFQLFFLLNKKIYLTILPTKSKNAQRWAAAFPNTVALSTTRPRPSPPATPPTTGSTTADDP